MTVQLFATCLGDLVFPTAVADAETLLREAGHEVVFPRQQICCGQPAYNAGHRSAARRVAKTFAQAFAPDLPVVVPSGSCATMLSHYVPELVGCEPYDVWELSAFLDQHAADVPRRNDGRVVAYHDSCHMLRELHDLPSAVAIVTGPSRTADIEQTLVVGVHGPREVRVLLRSTS